MNTTPHDGSFAGRTEEATRPHPARVSSIIDTSGDGSTTSGQNVLKLDAAPTSPSVPGSAERERRKTGAGATTRRVSTSDGSPSSVEPCSKACPDSGSGADAHSRPRARLDTHGDNYPKPDRGGSACRCSDCSDTAWKRRERLRDRSQSERRGDEARRRAFHRLDVAQSITSLKALSGCMRWPIKRAAAPDGTTAERTPVEVRVASHEDGGTSAYFGNVQTCKSPWACPVCSRKIRQRHALEAETALQKHIAGGGAALMGLLTVPHQKADRLSDLLEAVQEAWSYVTTHSTWARKRKGWAYAGFIRSIEITHGPHGWHPHVHYVLCTDRILTTAERRACATLLHRLFAKAVEARGLRRPLRGLCRLEPVRSAEKAGQYVAKGDAGKDWNAALELMRHDLKEQRHDEPTRHDHVTPFEILDRYATYGQEADSDLWYEYEQATRGVRSVTWSQGQYDLRDRYDVEEQTDEEAAQEEQEESEVVALIDIPTWRWICTQPRARGRLLVIARIGDKAWLREEIEAHRRARASHVARDG